MIIHIHQRKNLSIFLFFFSAFYIRTTQPIQVYKELCEYWQNLIKSPLCLSQKKELNNFFYLGLDLKNNPLSYEAPFSELYNKLANFQECSNLINNYQDFKQEDLQKKTDEILQKKTDEIFSYFIALTKNILDPNEKQNIQAWEILNTKIQIIYKILNTSNTLSNINTYMDKLEDFILLQDVIFKEFQKEENKKVLFSKDNTISAQLLLGKKTVSLENKKQGVKQLTPANNLSLRKLFYIQKYFLETLYFHDNNKEICDFNKKKENINLIIDFFYRSLDRPKYRDDPFAQNINLNLFKYPNLLEKIKKLQIILSGDTKIMTEDQSIIIQGSSETQEEIKQKEIVFYFECLEVMLKTLTEEKIASEFKLIIDIIFEYLQIDKYVNINYTNKTFLFMTIENYQSSIKYFFEKIEINSKKFLHKKSNIKYQNHFLTSMEQSPEIDKLENNLKTLTKKTDQSQANMDEENKYFSSKIKNKTLTGNITETLTKETKTSLSKQEIIYETSPLILISTIFFLIVVILYILYYRYNNINENHEDVNENHEDIQEKRIYIIK
jgi:hypothetical protein